jgi:hypothetical protein
LDTLNNLIKLSAQEDFTEFYDRESLNRKNSSEIQNVSIATINTKLHNGGKTTFQTPQEYF